MCHMKCGEVACISAEELYRKLSMRQAPFPGLTGVFFKPVLELAEISQSYVNKNKLMTAAIHTLDVDLLTKFQDDPEFKTLFFEMYVSSMTSSQKYYWAIKKGPWLQALIANLSTSGSSASNSESGHNGQSARSDNSVHSANSATHLVDSAAHLSDSVPRSVGPDSVGAHLSNSVPHSAGPNSIGAHLPNLVAHSAAPNLLPNFGALNLSDSSSSDPMADEQL